MPRSSSVFVLKKRSAFLAVASHRQRWVTPAFIVQTAPRPQQDGGIGIGFTTSKKMVGTKAVDRNRARRRLREIARAIMAAQALPDRDYVLIAKADALTRSFDDMKKDLVWALKRLKAVKE